MNANYIDLVLIDVMLNKLNIFQNIVVSLY